MRDRVEIDGEDIQGDEPNWEPLENLVGYEGAGDFKWFYEVELADGARVQVYRHIDTREWLHLDLTGRSFLYTESGRYHQVPTLDLIRLVLPRPGWAEEGYDG